MNSSIPDLRRSHGRQRQRKRKTYASLPPPLQGRFYCILSMQACGCCKTAIFVSGFDCLCAVQASQIGLWSVWLSGFLLISLSLYSTSHLPSLKERIARPGTSKARSSSPSVAIFTCPRPFVGLVGSRQALAIRSWLATSPATLVVLLGDHPSLSSFAGQFGRRISVDSEIDFT